MITQPEAWGAALLRAVLGVIYVMHGGLALLAIGPGAVADAIARLGYPAGLAPLLAWYQIVVQLAGGVMIVLGFWTRAAALLQMPVMLSALFLVHLSQGFFMKAVAVSTPTGVQTVAGGYELSLLMIVATLALVFTGPGAASLDGWRRPIHIPVP